MQQRSGREAVRQLAEQHTRQPALLGAQGQCVPFRPVHVVDGDERGLAAHGEAHVVPADVALDRLADLEQVRPLFLGIGLGGARRLAHARHCHRMLELDLGLLERALDRRRAGGLGRAGERDVAFAGQQAGGRVEADPAGARQVDLAPGVEVGEVVGRSFRPFERLLVGDELNQVTRGEARGEAQVAQDHDQQPAGVAARSLGTRESLLAALHARLQADDVADLALQAGIQADDEIDRALLGAVDRREPGRQSRAERLQLSERRDLLRQRGIVGEGPRLGRGLQEEVERIDDRHVGHQVDRDLELPGLFRKHQPREVVALRVLLPVDEVLRGGDFQGIGENRRSRMRCRTQAHDLRSECYRPIIQIGRSMMQRDLDTHATSVPGSEKQVTCRDASHLQFAFIAQWISCGCPIGEGMSKSHISHATNGTLQTIDVAGRQW